MNKTVYVPSYFQPIYKEVTVKVPTGNTKRFLGLIDIDEKSERKKSSKMAGQTVKLMGKD